MQRILKAREEWGELECGGHDEVIPRLYLGELLEGIGNGELRGQLEHRLEEFLGQPGNQEKYRY